MTQRSLELPASTPAPDAPALPAEPEAAPSSTTPLVLEAPAPVAAVAPPEAEATVPISDADRATLDAMVANYVDSLTTLDTHGQAFSDRTQDIAKLGDEDIRASAAVPNRLLDKPLAAMQKGGLTESSAVGRSLVQLRRQIEELDPARQGDLLTQRRLFGILPFGAGNRLRDYFAKYQSSQRQLDGIITALYQGQDELQRDNASIEQEKLNLWRTIGRLRQYAYLAQRLDTALTARIATIEPTDPERARVFREDLLFYVRQKNQDLLTQLAVSVQGYLALDIIRRDNLELIKGVQRATTTTVSALRTAVIVAQALADQKLVLDQIGALNATTSSLIESTSELLRQQSGAINQQAASATVDLAKLQSAFDNVYATIDEIDAFKVAALEGMQKTVSALSGQIAKSQAYLDRVQRAEGDASDRAERGGTEG